MSANDVNIVLLATAWGPQFGGINSFNRDLASGLAEELRGRGRVFCAVPNPSPQDKADAASVRVTILPLEGATASENFDPNWTAEVHKQLTAELGTQHNVWWVGHDVTSGRAALAGAEANDGQAALIMHMSYVDYQSVKHGASVAADAKATAQAQLFRNKTASLFAVGPLLRNACRRLAHREPTMLVPGLPAFSELHHDCTTLQAITFGRMDLSSDRIKQGRLAVAAFAVAFRTEVEQPSPGPCFINPRLHVIGVSTDTNEDEEIRRFGQSKAGRAVNIYAMPYDRDRNRLMDRLAEANLALMLSWHEGFGLTGWEAIAAEVPLIVGKNSGLFQLIDETLGGPGTGCLCGLPIEAQIGDDGSPNFTENDLAEVAKAIRRIGGNLQKYQRDSTHLKKALKDKLVCTWQRTAQDFLNGLVERPQQRQQPGSGRKPDIAVAPGPSQSGRDPATVLPADNRERLEKLKKTIVGRLRTSRPAMDALAAAMVSDKPPPTEDSQRAIELVSTLMEANSFEQAVAYLDHAFRALEDSADPGPRAVIVFISHHLVPWLYVDRERVDVPQLRSLVLSDIVPFPAGLRTFAEIIMAGLEIRQVQFDTSASHPWPRSRFEVALQPEGGPANTLEADLRKDLLNRVSVPPDIYASNDKNQNEQEQDDAIQRQLEFFCTKRNIRYFWICEDPGNDPERRAALDRINIRYPALAIIQLNRKLFDQQQTMFNNLRDLLQIADL
jgi:hypothetical protein